MEEEFRALLLADGSISVVVGARINFGAHPQGEPLPAIVMNSVAGSEGLTMQGPDRLLSATLQVDCYALSYGGAKTLSREVVRVLNGYRGGSFKGIFSTSSRDSREGGSNEAERPFRVSLDFDTHWRD